MQLQLPKNLTFSDFASKFRRRQKVAIVFGLTLAALFAISTFEITHVVNQLQYHYWTLEHQVRKAKRKRKPKKVERKPKKVVRKSKKEDDKKLHLAWILAFPFSGSNLAIEIIQKHTGYSMATNYGHIVDTRRGFVSRFYDSVPVEKGVTNGPYKYQYDLPAPPPGNDIIVKTHCSGHCIDVGDRSCGLKDYTLPFLNKGMFFRSCATGTNFKAIGRRQTMVVYNPYKIKKVVFLVRAPLEIIKARFLNDLEGPEDDKFHPNANGLAGWCKAYDNQRGSRSLLNFMNKESKKLAPKVTCYAELYRIVMFFKQSIEVNGFLGDNSHTVYFEDYATDYAGVTGGLFKFLDLPLKKNSRKKQYYKKASNDNYSYYSRKQVKYANSFIKAITGSEDKKIQRAMNNLLGRYM